MSEQNKNNVIKSIYYDESGFGSMQSTYDKAKKKDSKITMKDVRNWFYINVENIAKAKGYNSYINDEPYEEYQMDLIFFGREDGDENLALSMIDIFSKWAVVVPMESKSKEDITDAILRAIREMNPKKKPKMIYSDNDAQFKNDYVHELMEKEGVHLYQTKQAAMVVERFNRTFKNMMWKRIKANKKGFKIWRSLIPQVLVTYNYEMVSTVTGMTPNDARKLENRLQVKINLEMHRHQTRKYPTIEVGDYVRVFYKKQTQAKKEHLTNWSEDKYKVESISESFGQKYYHLADEKRLYLRHDLKKVAPPTEE